MEKLARFFSLGQNSCNDKNSESIEKSLQDWKLPPSSSSDVYEREGIFSSSYPHCVVKTVEEEILLSQGYRSFPLFSNDLKRFYKKFKYLHIGMVQVGLKPTKLGSNTSAMICLRDKRFLRFHQSLLGLVESSLCDGPIYFSYFATPNHGFPLNEDLDSTLTLDVKIEGSNSSMMHGEEKVVLIFRYHYKALKKFYSRMKDLSHVGDEIGKTTLFLTNVAERNRVVSRQIYWDRVSVPERWVDENNSAASASEAEQGAVARVGWKETAEAHVLKVNVPGFKKEEVKVEIEAGRALLISGERREEAEDEEWRCLERSSGKFLRRYALPEDAKSDEVKAAMENGVLTVTMLKEKVIDKAQVKVVHISG